MRLWSWARKGVLEAAGVDASMAGREVLLDPKHNRGQAFAGEDRAKLGLLGLMPAGVESLELQVLREMDQVRRRKTMIERYDYLVALLDRNVQLFYRVLVDNVTELMPVVYTPTVGQACVEYGMRWSTPRGVYVSMEDAGRVSQLLANWPEDDVRVIVFTDGERILGLGDLGVNGMGIPVGKLQLYSACAGIDPHHCLPVTIDVGTNNKKLLEDPFYQGLKRERLRGQAFDDLIEEFMASAVARWGRTVLMQFEDFGNTNAFRLLENSRERYTTFNDDIQGTAAVTLAGVIASLPETAANKGPKSLAEHCFLFLGAGEAGTGIANLIAHAILEETGGSITIEEARKNIWLVDSKGLVTKSRADQGGLAHHKLDFAHELQDEHVSHLAGTEFAIGAGEEITSFEMAVRALQPTALIGVSAIPKTFTQPIIEHMAELNANPLIFALSNPTHKAECTAEEAYTWSEGRCIFASGSPFGEVTIELKDGTSRSFEPGQGNNAYIFPGLGLGVLAAQAKTIPDELLYVTAQALAEQVTESDRDRGSMYPPLDRIRDVSAHIAAKVAERAHKLGLSSLRRKPDDYLALVKSMMHEPGYKGDPAPKRTLSAPVRQR